MLDDKSTDLGMTVVPLEGGCGAIIEGVDLTREISDAEFRFVKQAWDDNLVLVFRGQNISEDAAGEHPEPRFKPLR